VVKELDGGKKARCVGNGSSHRSRRDRTGSRIFYAVSVAENMLVYGSDVSNAFAEAPPPKQGFFISPNRAFDDWWVTKKGKPPIPDDPVIPVLGAMQGHPESPRHWEKHIDWILRDIGLTPTIHEPCIYFGLILRERVLFMRQVGDFAISAPSQRIAIHLLDLIDNKLSIPMKRQGIITLYNGLDILQNRDYIKVSCKTYIDRVWLDEVLPNLGSPRSTPHYPTIYESIAERRRRPQSHKKPLKRKWGLAIIAALDNWFLPWSAVGQTSHSPQSNSLNTIHAQEKSISTEYATPSNIYDKLVPKASIFGEQPHAPNLCLFHCQLYSVQSKISFAQNASNTMLSMLTA
jgi:hypothetical protein